MIGQDIGPFLFEGSDIGCLLIHGLTNTPHEMRGMGDYLAQGGLTVLGVLLAGHGTSPEEMAMTTWRDWFGSAVEGLEELKERCKRLFVAGISGGGLIALYLGLRHPLDGIIAISVPVYLKDWRLRFLPILRHLRPWYRETRCDPTDSRAWARYYAPPASYERKPTAAAMSLMELQGLVRENLERITIPVLLIHGARDRTIPRGNADYIYEHLGSEDKRLL
ncbi:MAG: alpha/beta hydrolase, partial [Anaerolineae bacterium]